MVNRLVSLPEAEGTLLNFAATAKCAIFNPLKYEFKFSIIKQGTSDCGLNRKYCDHL